MDVHNRDSIAKFHVSGTSLKLMPHTIQDIPGVCLLMHTYVLCIFGPTVKIAPYFHSMHYLYSQMWLLLCRMYEYI